MSVPVLYDACGALGRCRGRTSTSGISLRARGSRPCVPLKLVSHEPPVKLRMRLEGQGAFRAHDVTGP